MMKHLYTLSLLFVVALLTAAPAALAQQGPEQDAKATNLRPKWTAGQTAKFEFWNQTKRDETTTLMGKSRTRSRTYQSEGTMQWTVDKVNDDGSYDCTMALKKLKYTVKVGKAKPVIIDSENPTGDSPIYDELAKATVTTPLKFKVKADGTIASVEGLDAMEQAVSQKVRDAKVLPEKLDMIETASELATLLAAPAEATVGQTWNDKRTWNHQSVVPNTDATVTQDTTYTFKSLGQIEGVPIATIKATSEPDFKFDFSKLPGGGPELSYQVQESAGGSDILFDLSRNETVARNDTLSYKAQFTMTFPGRDGRPPLNAKVDVVETNKSQLLRVSED